MLKEKVQIILGLWLIISPWILGFSAIIFLTWSNIVVGTAIFLFNLWAIFGREDEFGKNPKP